MDRPPWFKGRQWLVADETTVPRLHLIGTLLIVLGLTLALAGFFSWQSVAGYRASMARLNELVQEQQEKRLQAEMDSAMQYIGFMHPRFEERLRHSLVEQVDAALAMAQALHAHEAARRPPAEVRQLIVEALRPMRFFDGRGYFFIDDMAGRFVLLPTAPQLEGTLSPDNRDDRGQPVMSGLIEAARPPRGKGFLAYRWYPPDNAQQMRDKLAYVRYFEPYDWLIGAGDYLYQWEQQQQQEALAHLRSLRFGRNGYFGAMDRDGRLLLLAPADSSLEGRHYSTLPVNQRQAMETIHRAGQAGGGLVHYAWQHPETGRLMNKMAFVRVVEPWGWVLVATVFEDELMATFERERAISVSGSTPRWLGLGLALGAALAVALGASLLFSRWSGRLFAAYHRQNQKQIVALDRQAHELRTLSRAVEQSPVSILITDTRGRITYVNPVFERRLGYLAADMLGHGARRLNPVRADHAVRLALVHAVQAGRVWHGEMQLRSKHGGLLWEQVQVSPILNAQGATIQYVATMEDITLRKQHEADLRIAATAFESQHGLLVADARGTILKVNRAYTDITGYSAAEAVGQSTRLLQSGRHDAAFYAAMWQALGRTGRWEGEIWNRRKNGQIFPEWLTITAVRNDEGVVTHYISGLIDITQRKADEDKIRHLAFYDPLTGLPNRRLLLDRLHQVLLAGQRRQREGALIFIDLDNFKTLNDTLGHISGDQLLQRVGERLAACVRETDTVARLGGDEFVVMVADLGAAGAGAAAQAEKIATQLHDSLTQPYDLSGFDYHCTPSMGVALFDGVSDALELLRRADLAMYQAKAAGRNTLRFFDPVMQDLVTRRAATEVELRQAIGSDQLRLYYQVQVSAAGKVLGAEALVRWQHPVRGLVMPGEFIGLAEDTGLILPLGQWVLEAGCRQLALWAAQPQSAHLTLAVNVSARQFHQPGFVQQVMEVLLRTGAPAQRLKLELTESILLLDVADTIERMTALRQFGVGFSLDDFGTGYSSLAYLKRLPLDQLKIDQSFVRDLLVDTNDATIARTIIALGQSLGLSVIAEGVETTGQRDCLAGYGCNAYQGYLYGRPCPAQDLPLQVTMP
jgi:diguanylate cyclase (GGDEF)-like protein/PAS domain S-box-containing protein